ncbi:choice-of-anchor G family protein [Agrococcus jejuensis]|uniref:choice-of-anchor G family protein n=1 Tax=Agrococcus jejuensis TaxID=399736 RepID=UPI0011A6B097|nr:choice-of-anchor G family protein [Agrococcus jejuensis]
MRRTAAWKPIAGVAAATIAIAGFGVAPATAAPGDPSQALAEVLRAQLIDTGLVQAGSAYAANPGGPSTQADDLDVALLDGDVSLVTGGLQLPLLAEGATPGLLDLGQAGVLSSYASTPSATSAVAASGLITDDGAIAFDVDEEPPTASTASLDATALLSQLEVTGLTDAIVDELGLTVGAVASRVEDTGTGAASDYRVADLTLDLHSDLVAGLSTELESSLTDELAPSLQTTLNGVVGTGGALTTILGALNLNLGIAQLGLGTPTASITLADLSTVVDTALSGPGAILVSDDESVTVNLTDGTVTVDLAQLVNPGGTGLNGLDPNTEVLDADTIALITDGIANALGKVVTPLTNAIGDVVDDSVVDITIPITANVIGPVASGSISIQGTITELITATPATAPALVDVNLTALGVINLDALTDAVVSLVVGSVVPPLGTALTGVLNASDTTVSTALEAVVDGLLDVLDPVLAGVVDQVASITINAQPTLLGQPADIDEDGAFTVRALEVTLLPDLGTSALLSLPFASSTVVLQDVAAAGTLVVDPDRAHPGDTVDLSGDGWDPEGGDVVVTFRDANGTQVGAPVTLPVADGAISGTFTVPAGTAAGQLTATAVQGEASTTDGLEVVAAPVIIVDPDPVDPGDTITITGSGFLCGPVTVTILDGDTVLETIEDVAVATDGTWSTTYLVPADIDVTSLTIRAEGQGTCDEDGETPVDVDLPESLDLTPVEVRAGDDVAIAGDGWAAGTVTVTFTNAGGQVGSPVPVTVAADGVLDGSFEVPTGTAAGVLTGTAVQGDDSETDTVTVFGDATVAVDPTSTRAGGVVDVTGTGWLPSGGDVVVTVTDADDEVVTTVTIPEAEIGDDGSIADEFTVPVGTEPGSLTVTAVQGDVDAATSLTVVPEPSVTVTPDTARPLDQVAVGGGGWGPGIVTVVFTDEDDQPVGDPLELTSVDGVISGSFTVPEGTEPGTLTATATQGTDVDTAELEVTLAPTVTATPAQVHGGDAVTIGGPGWGTDPVVVTITDGTTVIGTPLTLTPIGGVIAGTYPIPDGTDPADLTVTADDGTDEATAPVEVVADAVVVADPDPVDPGDAVTITGTGFLCGPVDVVITSGSTTLVTFTNVPVVDNEWTQTWTVPAGIAVDSVTITATTAATAPCDDEAETELEIDLDETLAATPATVERGGVVTVSGTGWSDGIVSIIARAPGGAIVGSFTATSADATFSTPFTVPAGTPLGTLTFTAVQGSATETASVTVVQIPTGPATLIASPSTVEPGDDVAIDGLGWDPTGPAVSVTIVDEDGAVVGSFPVAVLPDGRLATGTYTVPAGIDAPQTLTATGVQGSRSASDTIGVREANLPVIRLAGPQRWETSVEISRDAYPFGASVVYLASGENFPDALSAAPAAAQESAPLLLTQRDALPSAVAQELDRLDPDVVVVVGGPAAISESVASAAGQYAGQLVRAGGANRYETSVLITDRAFGSADEAFIASGANFPDALTAGAAAGAAGSPLLLTYGSTPSAQLLSQLDDLGVEGVRIAGGPVAVASSQEAGFTAAGFDVIERYAGANRYETGTLVAQDSFAGPADRIYVATGERFPDALAGSAVAAAQNVPVYVSPSTCLWGTIPSEIDRLDGPQVVLLGGPVALNEDVFALRTC